MYIYIYQIKETHSFISHKHFDCFTYRAPTPKSLIFVMILCYFIGIFYNFFNDFC